MSTSGTGLQATSNANSFLGLTTPVHLPTLASADGEDSPHLPTPHHSQAVEVQGYTDIGPERQGTDFGQVDYFKYINNDNECVKSCVLAVKLDGLTAAGSGTNPRYADDVLCQAIDHVDFTYGGNVLQTLYGDEIHFRMLQETPEEELMRKQKLQAAGLTPKERATLAASTSGFWVYLEIPFWWTRHPSMNWHQYAFQRLTRIVIYWRTVDYILQQDDVNSRPTAYNGGTYILDHFIRFHISAIAESTKQAYIKMIEATGKSGWLYMINDYERLTDQVLSSGKTTHTFLLNTFSKFAYNFRFWIRPVANLTPAYTNNERFKLLDISQLYVDISGKRYLPPTDDWYLKHMINGKQFLGNEEYPIYNISFTEYPDMHTHAMGGFELSNTTNPTLTIITGTLSADYYMDIYSYCHNYVRSCLDSSRQESAAETVQPL